MLKRTSRLTSGNIKTIYRLREMYDYSYVNLNNVILRDKISLYATTKYKNVGKAEFITALAINTTIERMLKSQISDEEKIKRLHVFLQTHFPPISTKTNLSYFEFIRKSMTAYEFAYNLIDWDDVKGGFAGDADAVNKFLSDIALANRG